MRQSLSALFAASFAILFSFAPAAHAVTRAEVDADVSAAIERLRASSPQASVLLDEAAGALVIPKMSKFGIGLGFAWGTGALVEPNQPNAYYRARGLSAGLLFGARGRTEVLIFLSQDALSQFKLSLGWEIGVDAEVTVVELGAGREFDSSTLKSEIVGVVLDQQGLLIDVSLDGTKYLARDLP